MAATAAVAPATSSSWIAAPGGSTGAVRGRSPKGRSPKSSTSPEDNSRSASNSRPTIRGGWPSSFGLRSTHHASPPRAASPYNDQTDYDILFALPQADWHRFEARVGVADCAAGSWPAGSTARFLLIDEDAQTVLWESTDLMEPWAPTGLCSVVLQPRGIDSSTHDAPASNCGSGTETPQPGRRLCLRVQCAFNYQPDGALWIEPTITALRPSAPATVRRGDSDDEPWKQLLSGELALEIVVLLQCHDAARLISAWRLDGPLQQLMWHFLFAQNFQDAYARWFLHPLRGQPRPVTLPTPSHRGRGVGTNNMVHSRVGYGASPPRSPASPAPRGGSSSGAGTSAMDVTDASAGPLSAARGVPSSGMSASQMRHMAQPLVGPLLPAQPRGLSYSSPARPSLSVLRGSGGSLAGPPEEGGPPRTGIPLQAAARAAVRTSLELAPSWAHEGFDWRQICKKFYLAQLLHISVNFQLHNSMTPAGFVKDSGDTLQQSRGPYGPHRYGWNVQLGADHFLSCPSTVVAHRSPLGVAGVPPNVATVRGTAGPEPLAMTPTVSERDSSVILPQATGQVRPQWTLEVDPGRYLVVATVGDRNVGFMAHLEVGRLPLFSGEWIEAGSFKSKCVVCASCHGAITVGAYWPRGGFRDRDEPVSGELGVGDAGGGMRHDSGPPSPRQSSPRSLRNEALARGTRLVSLRFVAVPLAREVERDRRAMFSELNHKLAEATARLEICKQLQAQVAQVDSASADPRGAGIIERDLDRAQSKLEELHAQKALKLFSMVPMCKRVSLPYIYLTGEASSTPPVDVPELERTG